MDPITQGAVGATCAALGARRKETLPALALGALAGMAADLDVLIQSPSDALLALEYHRHFTHALAFAPIGALVCAAVLCAPMRRHLRFGRCYLFCLLGYLSHGLLDACTSWGTALLWPFSEARVAWNLVAVVDPLFTLPIIGVVVYAAVRRRPRVALYAMTWAVLYLVAGGLQRERVHAAALALAADRGHVVERITVKPAFGNIALWKSIYSTNDAFHVDAVRVVVDAIVLPGTSVRPLDVRRDLPWLPPDSRQAADVERFRRFADGWVSANLSDVVDVRYSMVPNQIDALWGIRLDASAPPDLGAQFIVRRNVTPAHRAALLALLRGDAE